jgi:ribonuclease P protein component
VNTKKQYTLGGSERVKSRKLVEQLFQQGQVLHLPPFRISYLLNQTEGLQFGVGAGTRYFKKAVDRNRIKRLVREAYRLQKNQLHDLLQQEQKGLAVFFVFTGKEIPDQSFIFEKVGLALEQLKQRIHEAAPTNS